MFAYPCVHFTYVKYLHRCSTTRLLIAVRACRYVLKEYIIFFLFVCTKKIIMNKNSEVFVMITIIYLHEVLIEYVDKTRKPYHLEEIKTCHFTNWGCIDALGFMHL